MKKTVLTISLLGCLSAMAQTKTPVIITQDEAKRIQLNINYAMQIIHRMDISSLKRDTIDIMLGTVYNFIDEKNKQAAKQDTVKKVTPKKN